MVFTIGDQVLIKNVKEQERKGGKMESTFLGPLVVLQVRGKFATLASLNSPRKTVANVDLLTHFIDQGERIPAKLKKVGNSPLASPSPSPPPPPPSSPDPPLGTLGERQPSPSNSTFSYVTLYSIIMISSLFNYYNVFNLQFLNESGQGS